MTEHKGKLSKEVMTESYAEKIRLYCFMVARITSMTYFRNRPVCILPHQFSPFLSGDLTRKFRRKKQSMCGRN